MMTNDLSKNGLQEKESVKPNEKHKSSVFSLLFSNPDVLRELYSAIEGVNLPPDIPIDINTLSNVLYMGRLNDISFTVDKRLIVLIEHQSTINENMPLRLLLYIARIYEKIISRKKLYQTKLEKIPRPEFIVLYNGTDTFPEQKDLKLSDAFMAIENFKIANINELPMELIVKVYNINPGYNPQILEKSSTLSGYSIFIGKIRENLLDSKTLDESLNFAVKYCIDNNVLKNFLEAHSSEVTNMLITEWNWDEALDVRYEEGFEQGIEQGIEQGEKNRDQFILNLINQGLSAEEIKNQLIRD